MSALLCLRLPRWAAARQDLRLLLSLRPDLSGARAFALNEALALSGPERQFARNLLERKTNLWLYRCHQQQFCGDFAVVDVSSARPEARALFVLELKEGSPLRLDAGGVQLERVDRLVAALQAEGVIGPAVAPVLLQGSGDALLARFCRRSSRLQAIRAEMPALGATRG
ncbi:MAG: hypothetical protein KC549_08710 [Myxococcales bacterium]|nr:hypothetical protein [Myxococcales bacterium]